MYYRQPNLNGNHSYLIEVNGEGEITIPPNMATVHLGVMTEGKNLLEAQQLNSSETTNIINSLLSLGIAKDKIKTFDYRIESEYDYDQGKQIFRGYKVTHLLQVKIEDLTMVGKIVDTAVQQGANYVANVQFSAKNKEDSYQQALVAAIENAIQKAQTIADTLKVHLFPTPILIHERTEMAKPFINEPIAYVKGVTSTQFEPGELSVKANVTAKFYYYP
ncbi:MAG: SIMPL domain-containing protein [Bacillota bacterium]|nr:SIMPL domain-containing protein [Bacillota bacterium]